MKTPVVFIVFNRPNTTARVFEEIRKVKPSKLFIISDAPRLEKPGEAEQCQTVREIVEGVDWDCAVFKNYAETNLGCAKRISSGLDWVFAHCESAIILEDDCLPEASFFPFCEALLERYEDDSRIMSISGQNSQMGQSRTAYSYYYSHFSHCWGWATWRRAWQHFDFDMVLLPEAYDNNLLESILPDKAAVKRWTHLLNKVVSGELRSWAYRWSFACWMNNGLSVIANSNLISNIGFGEGATNTGSKRSKLSQLPTVALEFPLKHPPYMVRNVAADNFVQKKIYNKSWHGRLKALARTLLGRKK